MSVRTRLLPASIEAETALLGAALLDGGAFTHARGAVEPAHFYHEPNRRTFAAMVRLHGNGKVLDGRPPDLVLLKDELRRSGELEAVGGAAFLASLLDAVPAAANAAYYVQLVREKACDRDAIAAAQDLQEKIFGRNGAGPGEAREDIELAAAALRKALDAQESGTRRSAPLVDLDVAGLLARGGWEPVPVLDDFLWHGTFTYLSGSSGSFKTWLMLTWAVALVSNNPFIRQAVHGAHRVLFVECESSVQILQRLPKVCAAYDVELAEVLKSLRVVVPAGRALRLENPGEARDLLHLANDHGATWVFVDSLRRVTSLNENAAEEMAGLADTAFLPLREAGHNVLLLEHPAKPMAGLTRNRKESMRGSGDKSAAADVVLHVDALETEAGRVAALSVAKCRFAPERDEPLFVQLRPTDSGHGLEFQEVDEPATARQGRKPNRLEQAKNIIAAERGRTPGLTFAQAVTACVAAGLSRRTAARAWGEG